MDAMAGLALLSSEVSFSAAPTDSSSQDASLSSTPPTTASPDNVSLASEPEAPKSGTVTASMLANAAAPVAEDDRDQQSIHVGSTSPAQVHLDPRDARFETPVLDAVTVAVDATPTHTPTPTEPPSTGRPRRSRSSAPVYNLAKLAGTDGHGKRRAKGDIVREKKRRSISGDTLVNAGEDGANGSTDALLKTSKRLVRDGIDALDMNWSIGGPATPRGAARQRKSLPAESGPAARRATRLSGLQTETLATKLAGLSKRGRKTFDKGVSRMSRELRRLQDTNEFAHIDTRPVRYTVWSKGRYIDPDEVEDDSDDEDEDDEDEDDSADAPPAKRARIEGAHETSPPGKSKRVKKWLDKGLYAGQEAPADFLKGLTTQEKKKLSTMSELIPSAKPNKSLPLPMYTGLRQLINGRDFKLPFDICNPLPPGQPKPAAYRTMTRNRFIGESAAYWKKQPHYEDFASKCVCSADDGCTESCQNRIMLYECDETNCNAGKAYCANRAFQNLQARTKKGGRYRVGVEVLKTADRGYGVRSNRCFEPGQIIMEYTGEIITEEECERRMNEEYKNNECYYLMSFDQNMIIDATTGSIARFVNHSCEPNCRMIKWIVSGQPRMALFAGDRPIMTGDELTYDYNFDPFSAKNVQTCLCGSAKCRGVLGPKSRDVKPAKATAKGADKKALAAAKASVKAGKRKLKDLLGGDEDDEDGAKAAKKRKLKTATGAKRSISSASVKVAKGAAKGAATFIRRSMSSISVRSRKGAASPKATTYKRRSSTSVVKAFGKKSPAGKAIRVTSSRSSSFTIVAAGAKSNPKGTPKGSTPKGSTPKKTKSTWTPSPSPPPSSARSGRIRTPSRKALESGDLDNAPESSVVVAASAKSPGPRKGLDLSRKPEIRLVDDA